MLAACLPAFTLMPLRRLVLVGLCAVLASSFSSQPVSSQPAASQTAVKPLMVFAAASLKTALDDIGKDWTAQGHAPVIMTYAASSTLAQQIAAGAPADLYIAADLDWMDWLAARGIVRSDQRRLIAGNRLVLITQKDNPVTVSWDEPRSLLAALGQGRLAMADPRSVPAGKYGKAALDFFGLWGQLSDKIIPADHVRAVVTFVARKEAPLGVVYQSDVKADPLLKQVAAFPQQSHPPIVYPAAIVAHTQHPDVTGFLDYLTGPTAQARLRAEGFDEAPPLAAQSSGGRN